MHDHKRKKHLSHFNLPNFWFIHQQKKTVTIYRRNLCFCQFHPPNKNLLSNQPYNKSTPASQQSIDHCKCSAWEFSSIPPLEIEQSSNLLLHKQKWNPVSVVSNRINPLKFLNCTDRGKQDNKVQMTRWRCYDEIKSKNLKR